MKVSSSSSTSSSTVDRVTVSEDEPSAMVPETALPKSPACAVPADGVTVNATGPDVLPLRVTVSVTSSPSFALTVVLEKLSVSASLMVTVALFAPLVAGVQFPVK